MLRNCNLGCNSQQYQHPTFLAVAMLGGSHLTTWRLDAMHRSRFSTRLLFAAIGLQVGINTSLADEDNSLVGQNLYAQRCAECHGELGDGTDYYASRLAGDLSTIQLAKVVQETMPEGDPGTLSDDEARVIAEYMYGEFYSPIAQARLRPPRIELSRLTVRQYRRSVADLVGSFRSRGTIGSERGLKGEYFNDRRFQKRAAERVDPMVAFEFSNEAPVPEIENPDLYSVRWQGSLLPTATGWHEIVVRTEQAVRLWVNDNREPIIDGYVKSGDQNEYTARMFLIDGRAYPVKFEFARSNQGVSDEEQHKAHEELDEASVALLWKAPHGTLRPIPQRNLSPNWSPEAYVCATPFPPDDRSYGWERGTSISPSWDSATTAAAIETAEYVRLHLDELAKARGADDRPAKLEEFCAQFVERAFRRPLDGEQREQYIDAQFAATDDPQVAVRRVVLLTLKSPRFLYREIGDAVPTHDTAARLAYTLWDAPPDEQLWKQTDGDRLTQDNALRRQAERMLADPRAVSKLRQFLLAWLQLDGEVDLAKNSELYPDFDDQTVADLRISLVLFLDELIADSKADYRRLFLGENVYINSRLAEQYGGSTAGDQFAALRLDDGQRAGVLTHPYVMAKFAYADNTSPIHRGVFLTRGVMGQVLKPPPEAIAPLTPDLHPDLTTRERVVLQTRDAACMTCHHVINPLGFSLERFDAIGRLRDTEGERPIDDSGHYVSTSGETIEFAGARELGAFLADSDEVSLAFVDNLFHYLVQQSIQAYGTELRDELHRKFVASDFNIRELAIEIAVATSPVGREADAESLAKK